MAFASIMTTSLARRLRYRMGLILVAAAAATVWWGLGRWEHHADWLRVEAPRRAVAGHPLPLRVHLAPLAEPTRVCADLHWATTRDTSMGYLAGAGAQAVGKEGGTFDFEIMVPPRAGLRFVTGVFYLSRTGSWSDHTLVAGTEVIPVSSNTAEQVERRLEPLRLQPPGGGETDHPHAAALPRWLTALLFLAAALAAWGPGPSAEGSSGGPGDERRWWQVLAVLLALACVWELLGLETWLGAQARAIARAEDFYYPRVVFQKVVISVSVAATVLFFLFIRRTRSSQRLLLCALALYLAISLVNLVSLHAIDRIADLSWHGLTLIQALKLGCAGMAALGVRQAGVGRAGQTCG
jgi:hypothetical protein